jgi:thiol:disulfide interchange protein
VQLTPSVPRPAWLQTVLTLLGLALLLAAYLLVMHALVDRSIVENKQEASDRDLLYAYVHLALFAGATLVGFLAGKCFSGLGFAFAALFLVVTVLGVTAVQIGAYELACHGHNDLVRHWQC